MKTVITGALGHIGSRLIRDLPCAFPGGEIIMLDNLSTQRYCSLFNLPREGNYRFIEADILDYDLKPLLKHADVVIHLAAITNAAASFGNPDQIEQVNFEGTQKVAQACLEMDTPIFFPSTTSVYGTQAALVDEDCSIDELKPQSPYAESKLKAEGLLYQMGQDAGLRYVICRFGTICGVSEGMRFHTAVNKFCWQSVMGLPLTIWSTALHQRRPYLSLVDAVESLKFIIQNEIYDNRIYNVVTQNLTPADLVRMIEAHVGQLEIQYTDSQIMNLLSYEVANRRFLDRGFAFSGNIENDISETISLMRTSNRAWFPPNAKITAQF
jgi:nucleoside-diphosphate-sugar epimerase